MITIQDKIINKLKDLPEDSLRDVLRFVEFLTWNENHSTQENTQDSRRPKFGSAKGLINITDDFDASLADHFDASLNEGDMKLKEDPILSVLGILSGEPLTNEEIDEELYGPIHSQHRKEKASGK